MRDGDEVFVLDFLYIASSIGNALCACCVMQSGKIMSAYGFSFLRYENVKHFRYTQHTLLLTLFPVSIVLQQHCHSFVYVKFMNMLRIILHPFLRWMNL